MNIKLHLTELCQISYVAPVSLKPILTLMMTENFPMPLKILNQIPARNHKTLLTTLGRLLVKQILNTGSPRHVTITKRTIMVISGDGR